jgi:tetratricopeptide (TPR) repeat protein
VLFRNHRIIKPTTLLLAIFMGASLQGLAKDELTAPPDEVPYGAASDYLVGRQLLKEGQYAEALGYLHLVYRTHPDVPAVAVDFQEALVAEGYFQDALVVMDRLVATYPDSLAYILQRSSLNLKLGNTDAALQDLRAVREQGGANLEVIMAEANLLATRGDQNQALDVLRDGIHLLPEQGDQLYLGMTSLMQRADQGKAIPPLMEEALATYPDSPELWLVWVRSLAGNGKHEQALTAAIQADAHFQKLSTESVGQDTQPSDPDLPPGHPEMPSPESFQVELADFYMQQGQVERALGILDPLARSEDLALSPSLWLARIYLGTGKVDQGKALLDQILTQWPRSGRAWFLKGKIAESLEDWTGAVPLFEKAATLAPYDPEIRLALVRAMLVGWEDDLAALDPEPGQLEKRALVEEQAVAALTLVPHEDAEGYLVLGYAFRTLKDPWRAEACFELAAAKTEIRIPALTQRSLCFDEMGEPAKARQALETLHTDFPDDPEVANALGYFLAEKGEDLELAVELVQKALDVDPGNGAFLDSMGWALFRLGRAEAAFDYMIQAVNILPDDPVIIEHLGMVLLELGQSSEAEGMLRRALALGGDRQRIEAVLAGLVGEGPDSSGTDRP